MVFGVVHSFDASNHTDKDIPRLPLSKQKEFKSIKNHIVYEADKLSKVEISLTELDYVEKSAQEHIVKDEKSIGKIYFANQSNEYAKVFADDIDKWKEPSVSSAAIRLLHHISKIFEDKLPQPQKQAMDMKIDSKRLRKLREKKLAAGQKLDDHSPQMYIY